MERTTTMNHQILKSAVDLRNLLFLFFCISSSGLLAQTDSFPDSWDSCRRLRGKDGVVLAWKAYKDSKQKLHKVCLLLSFETDSAGVLTYSLSHQYSLDDSLNNWEYCTIHWGPSGGNTMGFRDMHFRHYSQLPSLENLKELFDSWMLENEYLGTRMEVFCNGMNKEAWLHYFGYVPEMVF